MKIYFSLKHVGSTEQVFPCEFIDESIVSLLEKKRGILIIVARCLKQACQAGARNTALK